MRKSDTKAYSLFTGCLIPSRYPFIEKASRKVLESLGLELHDIEGASCCPNQMAIQSSDYTLWNVLAARNLCLAEELGHDILSLCNGCYDTLKSVNTKLKGDDSFRASINKKLAQFGLEFHGNIEVKHLVQVLHDDVGLNTIEKMVVKGLKHLKCAAFEGCHSKIPMDRMGFDDPKKPSYLEDLIKAIGGDCVSYAEHYSCCAGGLSVGRKDDVAPGARRVLRSVLDSGGKAVVVDCPFCFAQFFRSQKEINEIYPEGLQLPVFYITQLMGLAIGFSPDALGMPLHYENSVGNEKELVEEMLSGEIDDSAFTDEVTKSQLELCAKCLACVDDCQTAMTTSDYRPGEILELVIQGRAGEAIAREDIWYCMNCHECVERCPQHFGMVRLMVRLKNLAVENGIYPEVIGHRISELHETGYSFAPDEETRENMGLPKIKCPSMLELKKLMQESNAENSDDQGD